MAKGSSKLGSGSSQGNTRGGNAQQLIPTVKADFTIGKLPNLEGTDKQNKWANDIRQKWIDEQQNLLDTWGNTAPALMNAKLKATEAARNAGITYRDGEGSEIYKKTFESEMKKQGFSGNYDEYKDALDNYIDNSNITANFPKPLQRKALKNLGMTTTPKTKEVKDRIQLYAEASKLYAQSEKRSFIWINLKDDKSRRIVYDRGAFRSIERIW